jgi:hypothetical protein
MRQKFNQQIRLTGLGTLAFQVVGRALGKPLSGQAFKKVHNFHRFSLSSAN